MTRQLKPCGTKAAYQRHHRRGEIACDLCTEANRLANYQYRADYGYVHPYRRPSAVAARRYQAAMQQRYAADLREVIHLLALAFTTPPDKPEEKAA